VPEKFAIAKTSDIPEGEGRAFPCRDRMIAVFHVDGNFYAMDDFCPHQGASLAGGWIHDGCVACPWHAWRFQLDDGAWTDNPKIKTDTFPVTIQGEDVIIELP
jgi:nitrite reductase (NADH) small subunit/3-phenylpropionate/trans-cinnamate dioxygenase ferredoxin subunit